MTNLLGADQPLYLVHAQKYIVLDVYRVSVVDMGGLGASQMSSSRG